MPDFLNLLLESVGKQLNSLQYHYNENMIYIGSPIYDNNLRHGNISGEEAVYFGFSKRLPNGKHVFIVFQREQTNQMISIGSRFTVYLMRYKPVSMKEWFAIRNSVGIDVPKTNIGSVLHYHFQLSEFPSENWWAPQSEVEVAVCLEEAVSYLENYGIPWIEKLNAKPIPRVFLDERTNFNQAIRTALQKRLFSNGYILNKDPGHDTVFFSKPLTGNRTACIIFGFGFDFNGYCGFDVLLCRNRSESPFEYTCSADDVSDLESNLIFVLQKSYKMDIEQISSLIQTKYDSTNQLLRCSIKFMISLWNTLYLGLNKRAAMIDKYSDRKQVCPIFAIRFP